MDEAPTEFYWVEPYGDRGWKEELRSITLWGMEPKEDFHWTPIRI